MRCRWMALASVIGAGLAFGTASGEEVIVPLDGAPGYYGPYDSTSVVPDAGVEFYRVDNARVEWQGEGTAGRGWQSGPECEEQWIILPLRFMAHFFEDGDLKAHTVADWVGEDTYPDPESFDSVSWLTLGPGDSWEFLLDGRCDVEVLIDWILMGYCSVDVSEYPWGTLDSAQLVIVGVRAGDLDADGDVDLEDRDGFQTCFTGSDGGPIAPECGAGDFDRDDDIDCSDWGHFKLAWTGPPAKPPLLSSCDADAIPTISQWGMVAMTLALLTAGTLALFQRRSAPDS
ncbi:hypothetical protein N9166_01585 [bacterium]|nr:hypothetical protein [bacterium]